RHGMHFVPKNVVTRYQGVEESLRYTHGVIDAVQIVDQHQELVATKPADQIAAPAGSSRNIAAQGSLQPAANLTQQLIAGAVAQRIVDHFESIEVEEQHSTAALLFVTDAAQCRFQVLHEHGSVG